MTTKVVALLTPILAMTLMFTARTRQAPAAGPTLSVHIGNEDGMGGRTTKLAESREFLWRQFRGGTSATLNLASISKEGKRSDVTYEIKSLRPGTIFVQVTHTHERYGFNGQIIKVDDSRYYAYSLERVLPNNPYTLGKNSKVEVLSDDAIVSGTEYCLRFRDWNGDVQGFL